MNKKHPARERSVGECRVLMKGVRGEWPGLGKLKGRLPAKTTAQHDSGGQNLRMHHLSVLEVVLETDLSACLEGDTVLHINHNFILSVLLHNTYLHTLVLVGSMFCWTGR